MPAFLGQLSPFIEILWVVYLFKNLCLLSEAEITVSVSSLEGWGFINYFPFEVR